LGRALLYPEGSGCGGRMGWGGGGEQFVIGWVGLIAAWWYPVSVGLSSLHTYMRSGPARLLLKDSFTRLVTSGFLWYTPWLLIVGLLPFHIFSRLYLRLSVPFWCPHCTLMVHFLSLVPFSVPDPWHIGRDPDPWIRTLDLRIRVLRSVHLIDGSGSCSLSVTSKTTTKNNFFKFVFLIRYLPSVGTFT
jgi:hypothetical protein